MTALRIIAGPEAMLVERAGVRSRTVPLTDADDGAAVRGKAAALWAEIRALVAWRIWLRHRMVTAAQRRASRAASPAPARRPAPAGSPRPPEEGRWQNVTITEAERIA